MTVVCDSIRVHEDHEGALSGDAEYDLTAYVQGVKVGLTDKSLSGTICVGMRFHLVDYMMLVEGETSRF